MMLFLQIAADSNTKKNHDVGLVTLEKSFTKNGGVIGRSAHADWSLPDSDHIISNRHARIENRHEGFYLIDTSTNGTVLVEPDQNQQTTLAPNQAYRLMAGQTILIGPYEIQVVKIETTPAPAQAVEAAPAIALQQAAISNLAATEVDDSSETTAARFPNNDQETGTAGQNSALIQALCNQFDLNPEILKSLGEAKVIELICDLLDSSLSGLIDLLINRARVKNQLNADMTMIQSQENNILKHSVNAKQALGLFLQPQNYNNPSFLNANAAVKNAVADLTEHQKALFDGIKPSLQTTISVLDPKVIERKTADDKHYMRPGRRYKADCWKQYNKRYEHLQQNQSEALYQRFLTHFADCYTKD